MAAHIIRYISYGSFWEHVVRFLNTLRNARVTQIGIGSLFPEVNSRNILTMETAELSKVG